MRKRRYEILLPLTPNDGRPVSAEKFRQTRNEFIVRVGGISTLPGTIRGTWMHGGARYEDESIRLMVDVPSSKHQRQLFVDYKRTLMERFEQIEIYIVSYAID